MKRPFAACRICGVVKRAYGKGICRGCYRSEERQILAEARLRVQRKAVEFAEEWFSAQLSLAVLLGDRVRR